MVSVEEFKLILVLFVIVDLVLIGFIIALVKDARALFCECRDAKEKAKQWETAYTEKFQEASDALKESRKAQQTLEYIRKVLDGPRTIESLLRDYDNRPPMNWAYTCHPVTTATIDCDSKNEGK